MVTSIELQASCNETRTEHRSATGPTVDALVTHAATLAICTHDDSLVT